MKSGYIVILGIRVVLGSRDGVVRENENPVDSGNAAIAIAAPAKGREIDQNHISLWSKIALGRHL